MRIHVNLRAATLHSNYRPPSEGWGEVIVSVCSHLGGGVPGLRFSGGVPGLRFSGGGTWSQIFKGGVPGLRFSGGGEPGFGKGKNF